MVELASILQAKVNNEALIGSQLQVVEVANGVESGVLIGKLNESETRRLFERFTQLVDREIIRVFFVDRDSLFGITQDFHLDDQLL